MILPSSMQLISKLNQQIRQPTNEHQTTHLIKIHDIQIQHERVQITIEIHQMGVMQIDKINLSSTQDRHNDRMLVLIVVLSAIMPEIVPVPIFNSGSIGRWCCFQNLT